MPTEALIQVASLGGQCEFVVGEHAHVDWTDPPEFPGHAARDRPRNPGPALRVQCYQICATLYAAISMIPAASP